MPTPRDVQGRKRKHTPLRVQVCVCEREYILDTVRDAYDVGRRETSEKPIEGSAEPPHGHLLRLGVWRSLLPCLGFGVWGLGFSVQGLGRGAGSRMWGIRVLGVRSGARGCRL